MSRISIYFSFVFFILSCSSPKKVTDDSLKLNYHLPISWSPKTYVCQRAIEKIEIDGLEKEESWLAIDWSDDFIDIEGPLKPLPELKTNMKMLWDDNYFYFFAKMEEPHIWAKLTDRDAVIYQDDDFEIFIDPDGDAHNYYEFEINAFNTIWDLFMMWPYRHKTNPNYLFNWNVDVIHAVHVEGTLNNPNDEDEYWTVEMAIPWSALKEMAPKAKAPKSNDQWRINFSRVDWEMKTSTGKYEKSLQSNGKAFPEKNWVWSPQGMINMHMPEWWGYVQFSDSNAGELKPKFKMKPDEEIKWALWNLYYQQTEYFDKTGTYEKSISRFTIPKVENCDFKPMLFAGEYGFQFSNPSCNQKRVWVINEMGKIYSKKLSSK